MATDIHAFDAEIGKRIEKMRCDRGESREDLASSVGVSKEVVFHWERGTRKIKPEYLIKLARHFCVTSDYLLGIPSPLEQSDAMRDLAASEHTGLSAKAVSQLYGWNNSVGGQFLLGVVNDIILSNEIVNFLTSMYSLAAMTGEVENNCDSVEAGTFAKTDSFQSFAGAFSNEYDKMRLMRFQVSESLDDLIEDMYSYRAINKRCEPLFSKLVNTEIPEETKLDALKDLI